VRPLRPAYNYCHRH